MSVEDLLIVTDEERKCLKELRNKSQEELKEYIAIIREWLKKQLHLPQHIADKDIEESLYHNKYSLEKVKEKLDSFYSMSHIFPQFFKDRNALSPRIQRSLKNVIYVPLPKLTETFGRISVIKDLETDSEYADYEGLFIRLLMMIDIRVANDCFNNDNLIIDLKHTSLSKVLSFNPATAFNFFTLLQKGYTDIIRSIHIVNAPSYATSVVNLLKSFLKEKFLSRIYLHNDFEGLHQHFPKYVLPSDYGGKERSLKTLQDDWSKVLVEKNDWFLNTSLRCSNEALRVEPSLENEVLGIQGSFRQLSFD